MTGPRFLTPQKPLKESMTSILRKLLPLAKAVNRAEDTPQKISFVFQDFSTIWPDLCKYFKDYMPFDLEQQSRLFEFAKKAGMQINSSVVFDKKPENIMRLIDDVMKEESQIIQKRISNALPFIDGLKEKELKADLHYQYPSRFNYNAIEQDKILDIILERIIKIKIENFLESLITNTLKELQERISDNYSLSLFIKQLKVAAPLNDYSQQPEIMGNTTLKHQLIEKLFKKMIEKAENMYRDEQETFEKEEEAALLEQQTRYELEGYRSHK